jgi:hypothetical protein
MIRIAVNLLVGTGLFARFTRTQGLHPMIVLLAALLETVGLALEEQELKPAYYVLLSIKALLR